MQPSLSKGVGGCGGRKRGVVALSAPLLNPVRANANAARARERYHRPIGNASATHSLPHASQTLTRCFLSVVFSLSLSLAFLPSCPSRSASLAATHTQPFFEPSCSSSHGTAERAFFFLLAGVALLSAYGTVRRSRRGSLSRQRRFLPFLLPCPLGRVFPREARLPVTLSSSLRRLAISHRCRWRVRRSGRSAGPREWSARGLAGTQRARRKSASARALPAPASANN